MCINIFLSILLTSSLDGSRAKHKCDNFKSGSNGFTMVDYSIYNPINHNRRHGLDLNEI